MRNTRRFFADFSFLTKPYFMSAEWKSACGLLALLIGLSLAQVGLGLLITYSQSIFYTALQQKNAAAFLRGLFWFTPRVGAIPMPPFMLFVTLNLAMLAFSGFVQSWLQIRWQRWMTSRFVAQWMHQHAHYRMMLTASSQGLGSDNPDQRIQEDIEDVTKSSITLSIGLITSITTVITYGGLLWSLSGTVHLLGMAVHGYLFWSAIFYAAIFTLLTHLVGRPLAALDFQQQRLRGNFRFSLIKTRENSEAIALLDGEAEESRGLARRFEAIYANFMRIIGRSAWVNFMSMYFDQASIVFPTVIAAPRFFAGEISFGTLNQIRLGFLTLAESLLWFVSSYAALASYVAQIERLATFQRALDAATALPNGILTDPLPSTSVAGRHLTLTTPDGRRLVHDVHLAFAPGATVAIAGASGCGKSTLFRAIAGIWPFGSGTIDADKSQCLFLPQKPYLPEGTLRRLVCYPRDASDFETGRLEIIFNKTGLGLLVDQLDVDAPWSQLLSPGEQQRLAISRALLQAPLWLFLDEATSSLDANAERELYALLKQAMPATALISITHRKELQDLHDRVLHLERDGLSEHRVQDGHAATGNRGNS
jgi:putative ATP-binding cassette transporter